MAHVPRCAECNCLGAFPSKYPPFLKLCPSCESDRDDFVQARTMAEAKKAHGQTIGYMAVPEIVTVSGESEVDPFDLLYAWKEVA
jgi:hypothetical protein